MRVRHSALTPGTRRNPKPASHKPGAGSRASRLVVLPTVTRPFTQLSSGPDTQCMLFFLLFLYYFFCGGGGKGCQLCCIILFFLFFWGGGVSAVASLRASPRNMDHQYPGILSGSGNSNDCLSADFPSTSRINRKGCRSIFYQGRCQLGVGALVDLGVRKPKQNQQFGIQSQPKGH